MKIVTVVGARPQFIKASPVSRALAAASIDEVLVHTGQHYDPDMSDVFFEELALAPPARNLGVGSGSHADQTAAMLRGIEQAILEARPACVLVYGDMNSTLAAALAAAKLHVPIAHVEAGLRSFNRRMPEEINRIVADTLSDLLFAPTDAAMANLRAEGIAENSTLKVGDVMYDAVLQHRERARARSGVLQRLGLEPSGFSLATIHRAENTDDPGRLDAILRGLSRAAARLPVVMPLHPRTRAAIERAGGWANRSPDVLVTEPVGYLDMVELEANAALIITDSGGVQKEAFFHRVPCVTLRDETEWVELVELGWNRLCPPRSADDVLAAVDAALGTSGIEASPYGDGCAAQHIAAALRRFS